MSDTVTATDLLPARMLNEVAYCPRLFYLEYVAEEWADNADTVSGKRVHRRVDQKTTELPLPESLAGEKVKARSVTVASEIDGVVAKVDLVEAEGGRVRPVDYKRGAAPDPERVPGGIWPADRVQVGAQILALRANGYACDEGVVYYAGSKARVTLTVDDALLAEVRAAVAQARSIAAGAVAPPPLVDSPKCPRCSLVTLCLPEETHALAEGAPEVDGSRPVRRLIPSDDDRFPAHVQAPGATIGKAGGLLEVRHRDGTKQEIRIADTSHLSVYGQVQVTTAVIHELCEQGIGISFFSSGGWYYGALGGVATASVGTRIAQFRWAADAERALRLARCFVEGKILNCRTLLRRNGPDDVAPVLSRLKAFAEDAARAESLGTLLGIEGNAARLYFESFARLLAPRSGASCAFAFDGRNRRPPRDPVNALLSFAYSLLVRDARTALAAAGFDTTVGFLHQPRPGRPALALDLMEEFRPLVADSVVLTAVNTEAVQASDFVRAAGAAALTPGGRTAFISAYERRMQQEVTHPIFGYKLNYRRVLEVQARLLARTLCEEIPAYPSFQTR
jgi:CRISP-associated protein Cas1